MRTHRLAESKSQGTDTPAAAKVKALLGSKTLDRAFLRHVVYLPLFKNQTKLYPL